MPGPTPEQIERANAAFQRFVHALAARQGTSKPAVGFMASQEFAAAFVESSIAEQPDVTVNDVFFGFGDKSVALSAHVKLPGKAWPPRPPINTSFHLKVRELELANSAEGSVITFVVDEPLSFSSTMADLLVGLLGKLFSRLPVSISDLRTKDAKVSLNFTALVTAAKPDLAASAAQVQLHKLAVTPGHAQVEIGFSV